mmetsp:Transcript_10691/g.39973  ORF Transcript_10691/g.39973 Transcript_10691/m.39973 type:complete len:769 (-) Transcript_10691:412-2718(-)
MSSAHAAGGIRTSGFSHRTSFSAASHHNAALSNTTLGAFSNRAHSHARKHVRGSMRPHSASTTVRSSRKRRSIVATLNQQDSMEHQQQNNFQQFSALHNGNKRRNSLRDEIYRNRMTSDQLAQVPHAPSTTSNGINGQSVLIHRQRDHDARAAAAASNNFFRETIPTDTTKDDGMNSDDTQAPLAKPPRFQRPVTAPEHINRRRGKMGYDHPKGSRDGFTSDLGNTTSIARDTRRDIVESSVSNDGSHHNSDRSSVNNSKENQRTNAHNQVPVALSESSETSSVQLKPIRASPGPTTIMESKLRRGVSARSGLGKRSRPTIPTTQHLKDSDSLSSCSTIPLHDTAGKKDVSRISAGKTPSADVLKQNYAPSASSSHSGSSSSLQYKRRSAVSRGIGKCLNDFIMLDEIGSGGCGTVYKVKSKINHEIYVAKKVNVRHMTHKQLKETLSEVYLMKEIHHEHIVQFYTSFVENQNLYILMEYAESGDLHQYYRQQKLRRKYIKESFLWRVMYQICLALQYLHKHKHVIHRDVKALNVFLNSNLQVKLGDLGMSRQVKEEQMLQTNVGTPAFLSPEQIRRKPYDFKVDVWGLGCIMYSLAALRPPFRGDNILELSRSIVQDEVTSIPKHYSLRLRSLIVSMLAKNAYSRPSIQEIITSIPEHIREASSSRSINSSSIADHDNFFTNGGSSTEGVGGSIATVLGTNHESGDRTSRPQTPGGCSLSESSSHSKSRNHPLSHIQVKQPSTVKRVALSKKNKALRSHRKRQQWVS